MATSLRTNRPQEEQAKRLERSMRLEELAKELCLGEEVALEGKRVGLTFDGTLGWVECTVGSTRVLAQVGVRSDKTDIEENLTIQTEFPVPPVTDAEIKQENENVATIRSMVDAAMRREMDVDEESLRVASNRSLPPHLSLHLLADDGGLVDCAFLSAVIALRHLDLLRRRSRTTMGAKAWRPQMSTRRIVTLVIVICALTYLGFNFGKPFVEDELAKMHAREWARAESQWRAEVSAKYEEMETVSHGYNGIVKKYKAKYSVPKLGLHEGEIVAIKHLFPNGRKNFEDERDCLRTLRADPKPHPRIMISYEDYPTSFVLKFLEGQTLEALFNGRLLSVPEDRLAGIFRQVLEGTQHFHALGIFHGDLKPKNVIMGENDVMTIVDFGDGALMKSKSKLYASIDITTFGREGVARLLLGYEPTPSEIKVWHKKRDSLIQKGETFSIEGISTEASDLLIYMCSPLIKNKSAKEALSFAWLNPKN